MTNMEVEVMLTYKLRERLLQQKMNQLYLTSRQFDERPRKRRFPRFRRFFDPDREG